MSESEPQEVPGGNLPANISRWMKKQWGMVPESTIADKDAEIAELLKIGNVRTVCQQREEIAKLKTEVAHWKANHDEMVERNALLRDRTDLTAEQVAERRGWKTRAEAAERRAAELLDQVKALGETVAWLRSQLNTAKGGE